MSANPLMWVATVLFALCLTSVPVGYALAWELFAAICAIDDEACRRADALFGKIPGKSQLISMTEKRLRRMLRRDDVTDDPYVALCLRRLRLFRRVVLIVWLTFVLWIWTPLIIVLMTRT